MNHDIMHYYTHILINLSRRLGPFTVQIISRRQLLRVLCESTLNTLQYAIFFLNQHSLLLEIDAFRLHSFRGKVGATLNEIITLHFP